MELAFNQILLLIITIVISIVAIKFTFSFNINEYQKRKDEKLKVKIRNYCIHADIRRVYANGKISIESCFISPSGTTNWICQKCGLQRYQIDRETEKHELEQLLKDPKKLIKRKNKFEKLIKKAGYL